MTTQTKQILAGIHAELDKVVPGWRTEFTNFGAVLIALAGDARATKVRELVSQYRTVQQQLYRAIPTLPKVDGGVRDSGDRDVSIFDASSCGRLVSAERGDEAGGPETASDGDDTPHRGASQALIGRSEDQLYHPEEPPKRPGTPRPDKGAPSLLQRVRQRIGYDWRKSLSVFPSPPVRAVGCY